MNESNSPRLDRQDLGKIALVSLRAARMIMESGGRAQVIAKSAQTVACGLGAEFLGLRIGYASLAISLGDDANMITRMVVVGRHGVNHRLDQAVRRVVQRITTERMTPGEVEVELDRIAQTTPKHPPLFVAAATGLACAGFGRLLGVDWLAFVPILLASTLGQHARHYLLGKQMNPCVAAAMVAFGCALISSQGAKLAGSDTVNLAMIASCLLLVPGVPATNAQTDIMDGHPTMGSARAVSVLMIMIFATAGIWLAGAILGVHP